MATIKITGDEVQIDDIATETTQAKLLTAMGGAAGAAKGFSGSMNDAAKGTNLASKALTAFGSVATGTGKSLVDISGAIFDGSARVSSATDALAKNFTGGLGGAVTASAKTLFAGAESYVDTFRKISTSGGGFAGDIFEMKNSAAQARMTLDEFAGAIMNNSTDLAAMGGTVSKGARQFSDFTKSFYEQTDGSAQSLMALGMSTNEINEALMDQMKTNRRLDFQDQATRSMAMAATKSLAFEMDEVAKLTGKSKDQLKQEMEASARKGQVEAKFREIEMREGPAAAAAARNAYNMALTSASKAGPDAIAALEETFVLGGIAGEQARKGAVALGSSFDELQAVARTAASATAGNAATLMEQTKSMGAQFETALVARINEPGFLGQAKLASAGNDFGQAAASLLVSAGNLETAIGKGGKKAAQDEQVLKDTTGGNTTKMVNALDLSMKDLTAQLNEDLLGKGKAIDALAGEARNAADAISKFQSSGGARTVTQELTDALKSTLGIADAVEGSNVEGTEDQKTAMGDVSKVLDSMEGADAEQTKAIYALMGILADAQQGPEYAEAIVNAAKESGNDLATTIDKLTKAKTPQQMIQDSGAEPTLVNSIIKGLETGSIEKEQIIDGINATVKNMTVVADTVTVPNSFAKGTQGALGQLFKDFGGGELAMLHGKEAVVTEKQMGSLLGQAQALGQSLASEEGQQSMAAIGTSLKNVLGVSQRTDNTQNTKDSSSENTQKVDQALASMQKATVGGGNMNGLQNSLDSLNQNVLQLIRINNTQLSVNNKQLKANRASVGNVFKGVNV